MTKCRVWPVWAAAALAATGCGSQATVSHLYVHPTIQPVPARHVYVVGRAEDDGFRREIESGVAAELGRAGVRATTSHSQHGIAVPGEHLAERLQRIGADAVLVVRVGRAERTVERVPGRTEVKTRQRHGDPYDLFLSDYEDVTEPDSIEFGQTLVLVSSLHLAGTGGQVWAVQTAAEHRESLSDAISDQADVIINSLRQDRWLR